MPSEAVRLAEYFFKLRSEWLGAGGHPVSPKQAQARADVCLKCPKNNATMTIYELGAGAVARLIKDQIEYKNNQQLRVNGEKGLHICDACLCVLKLKVHVPINFVKDNTSEETMGKLDPNCWILSELKPQEPPKNDN